jgi:hypothetical protein
MLRVWNEETHLCVYTMYTHCAKMTPTATGTATGAAGGMTLRGVEPTDRIKLQRNGHLLAHPEITAATPDIAPTDLDTLISNRLNGHEHQ